MCSAADLDMPSMWGAVAGERKKACGWEVVGGWAGGTGMVGAGEAACQVQATQTCTATLVSGLVQVSNTARPPSDAAAPFAPPPPPPPAAAQRPPRSSHAGPVLPTSLAFPPSDNQATHKGAPTSPSVCADCRNSVLPLWSPSALKWRPRAAMACMVASPCPTADARRRLAARVETTACGRKGATGVWAGARGLQATARRLRCQPPCAGPARKAGRLAALPSQPLPRCTYLQGRLHLLPQLWAAGTHPAH